MANEQYISQITLPSGNTYLIKDLKAWNDIEELQGLVEALQSSTAFLGISEEPLFDGSTKSSITVDGVSMTPSNGNIAIFGNREFIYIKNGDNPGTWREFGDLSLVQLTTSSDTFLKSTTGITVTQPTITVTPSTTNVKATASGTAVGADGTASVVTGYAAPVTDGVLGSDATFTTTVTPTTTNIKATASGTAVGANGTAAAITGFGAHTTENFVKSVTADTTNKLVTVSIVPTNGTDTASLISNKVDGKLVTTNIIGVNGSVTASKATAATSQTTAIGTGTTSQTNTDWLKGVTVSGETLSIGAATMDTQTTTQFTFNNVTVPVAASNATTVATGSISSSGTGGAVVQSFTATSKTLAKQGAATTVATGAVATDGNGSPVVTDVSVGDSAAAITALGSATTANCLTGVKVTTQPTIALATGAAAGTGVISVATGITSASTTTNNKDEVSALTGLGTASTATVLTGVKVTAQPTVALSTGATAGTGVVSVATGISSATATGGNAVLDKQTGSALTSATISNSSGTDPENH